MMARRKKASFGVTRELLIYNHSSGYDRERGKKVTQEALRSEL